MPLVERAGKPTQELMTENDIKMHLDAWLKVKSHPIPQGMVGYLYTVDGMPQAAEAIYKHLERRAKLWDGHIKPQKEEITDGSK